MVNKKGQEMSTNTIILIILGLIVLVILVVGFTIGWDKILPWIKKDNNVDQVSQACELACSTKSTYDFCTRIREIKISGDSFKGTCNEFSNTASDKYDKDYGIKTCPDVTCP